MILSFTKQQTSNDSNILWQIIIKLSWKKQRKAREIEEAKAAAFMKKVITGAILLLTTIFLTCNLDNVKAAGDVFTNK